MNTTKKVQAEHKTKRNHSIVLLRRSLPSPKATKLMTLMLAMLAITGCGDNNDEPTPITKVDTKVPVLPVEDFQMWPTPTIDDSNLQGECYTFDYWQQHKGEAQTGEELIAMCNIPDDLLKNMSTANLAWTCFNHPYNTSWPAYNNLYEGMIGLMKCFNGYNELMSRATGREAAINLFAQLGYKEEGKTTVSENSMIAWTLILCSAADYRAFNPEQVARLAQDLLYKDFIAEVTSSANLYLSHKAYWLLGAFLAFHYDESLPEEERIMLANYVKVVRMTYYTNEADFVRSSPIIRESLERLADSIFA